MELLSEREWFLHTHVWQCQCSLFAHSNRDFICFYISMDALPSLSFICDLGILISQSTVAHTPNTVLACTKEKHHPSMPCQYQNTNEIDNIEREREAQIHACEKST